MKSCRRCTSGHGQTVLGPEAPDSHHDYDDDGDDDNEYDEDDEDEDEND